MAITDGLDLIDPGLYAKNGPPHETWTRLRRESPIHHCAPEGFEPFWAITRHADICQISKQPDTYLNAPGVVVLSEEQMRSRASGEGLAAMRTIIEMDPPEHRSYRKVASPWFTPRAVNRIDEAVAKSARHLVDSLAGETGEGECDFALDVATAHPLRILSTILGVPQEAEPEILRLTNQLFAGDDPELQREGEDREKAMLELGMELYNLFEKIIEDRRANPRDDLASLLANGEVDGKPMGPMETFGYYLITFTAGHDTTKNALVGGMRALVEHPDELEKLRRDPDLVNSAVEEIVRWTHPVNYMRRTVARDVELGGQRLREGEFLTLFYGSANRDEEVFDDPFAFRVDRDPNPHLGFGYGEHFCLGANLARRSQRALFRELVSRLEHVELAGEPEQIGSSFVIGLKHLPIRYRIKPRQ
ncbi:MAG: cytochrome P450 [Deltaproteobacteria bacterium]|nr:cytochrome P450 [Deltaproteobacteria bacterium]